MPDSAFVEFANLADFVRRAAAADPDRAALHYAPRTGAGGRTVSWRELDAAADAVAGGLAALDLRGGEHPARVAVALPNVPEFAMVLFGVLRAGLVVVPINPGYTGREVSHVLSDSGASVLISTGEVATAADGAAPAHTFAVTGPDDLAALTGPVPVPAGPVPAAPAAVPGEVPDDGSAGERLAMLLYTSGTSGAPKGAMLPHRALVANHLQLAQLRIAGPDDTVLLALPLFHAYGLNTGLGAVAFHGATGVLVDDFSPRTTLELIERHRVTVLIGVPDMFAAWAAAGDDAGRALRSVRVAVSGAAPLPRQVAERFAAATGIEVQVGYGLTETAPVLTSTLASPALKRGSIGRPVPGVELRLVGDAALDEDEEDELSVELDTSGTDPGEIEVRGANVFTGYWPDGAGGPDEDGWWATGDVAYADADGDLFLVDRIGELILVSGFNVYPHEVELVLAAHPAVAEAAVIGVPHEPTGQAVRAFVVPAPDAAPTEAELAEHCAANLARFKCPSSIVFIAELPHSATGKVRKTLLPAPAVPVPGDQDE
jgi:long-chain acyl-CoA synthetase